MARGSASVWRAIGSSRTMVWMVPRMFDSELSSASYIAARIARYWNVIVIAANVANAATNATRILTDNDICRGLTRARSHFGPQARLGGKRPLVLSGRRFVKLLHHFLRTLWADAVGKVQI